MALKKSELIVVAEELNHVLGLDPEIDVKGKVKKLQQAIIEAGQLIDPVEDEFTDETWAVLEELGAASRPGEENGVQEEGAEADEGTEAEEAAPEQEEQEEAPEPTKPSKQEKVKAPKKVGVIGHIAECIAASGKKGITKAEILESLEKAFPDRDPSSMKGTINAQVPGRLSKEKFPIGKTEDGRYFKEGK